MTPISTGQPLTLRGLQCPLVAALVLTTLLRPLTPQGVSTPAPGPGLDMHFDPRRMTLSWRGGRNATGHVCEMRHKDHGPTRKKVSQSCCCCCHFPVTTLHAGVNFTLHLTAGGTPGTQTLLFPNTGVPGSAADNFSCFIYEAEFMNCSWSRGPRAPPDVQYFLFLRDQRGRREQECPTYVADADTDTHVGCHLRDLGALSSFTYFLVNGSSRHSDVQFFDALLSLRNIEHYSPPQNISVTCSLTQCDVGWETPRTHGRLDRRDLLYQLDIRLQSKTRPPETNLVQVEGGRANCFSFPSREPRGRGAVRVRTADARSPSWGAWSPTVRFGCEDQGSSLLHVYLLVVLGTLVCGVASVCLCRRSCGTRA
ncbi:granulocyte-macrophage colony-stimulating factor receptor subunit alpha isoform X2 [Erinaceus europaeus]|uniref:Granulocyte-macrophage colony-stimulating factor receptor subunit alpha isoform X2 n=1 Tax=Erinaceus europaeus TaxID=9365 RepID=A0ABM3WRC5_ERIEU|nr:granulocyte-macrophage colony-stimulating factor receptor subunit alpha isoform X2 [Erinaceus europaeus]